MSRPTCATCRFSELCKDSKQATTWTECRVLPPTRSLAPEYHLNGDGLAYYTDTASWPVVKPDDWCGAHEVVPQSAPDVPSRHEPDQEREAITPPPVVVDASSDTIAVLADMVQKWTAVADSQCARADAVTAERDRYRQALAEIRCADVDCPAPNIISIARKALEAK